MAGVVALLIPVVAIVCVFTFISIAAWSDARRKEREAYYKSETLKKIAEAPGTGGQTALEYLREEERSTHRRREQQASEGRKLGGLVLIAVGVGLMLLLWGVTDRDAKGVYLVGAIPFLIGVALLVYSYMLLPKAND
jgi:Flp pilus assembly protein TadB